MIGIVDPDRVCLVVDAPGRRDPFGDIDHAREDLVEPLATADPFADGAVAAEAG